MEKFYVRITCTVFSSQIC